MSLHFTSLVPEGIARRLFVDIFAGYFPTQFQAEAEFRRAYNTLSTQAHHTRGAEGVLAAALHCATGTRAEGALKCKLIQFWSTAAAMAAAMEERALAQDKT